jgi:flagellar biosynthesis protein FlhG
MVVDQAEKLRLMVRNTRKTARVLAITSGKGGVGKSNVAVNLAVCLKAAGKDVVLVDADLGLANVDLLLGMKCARTIAQVVTQNRSVEEIVRPGPAGLRVVCGAAGLENMADLTEFQRQRLIQELGVLEHQTELLIIDTGAGISRNVLAFCEHADHTLVVTTPEPTSISDAYAMIKCLARRRSGTKISLLVNQARSREEAKNVFQRISHVARQFIDTPVYDAGYVLRDDRVLAAVGQREPVVLAYPRCQASLCFLALAQKCLRHTEGGAARGGFFQKVVNWFF